MSFVFILVISFGSLLYLLFFVPDACLILIRPRDAHATQYTSSLVKISDFAIATRVGLIGDPASYAYISCTSLNGSRKSHGLRFGFRGTYFPPSAISETSVLLSTGRHHLVGQFHAQPSMFSLSMSCFRLQRNRTTSSYRPNSIAL